MIDNFKQIHYIYKLTNLINNKIYIGQTIEPKARLRMYRYKSKNPVEIIEHAMAKHGFDNFKMEIIDQCESYEEINKLEEKYISEFNCIIPNGYNVSRGGEGRSHPHSEETKSKLSAQKTAFYQQRLQETGSKITEEERQKLSLSHLGKPSGRKGCHLTEEQKQHISQVQKGRKQSKETIQRRKDSIAANGGAWNKGIPNPNKGIFRFNPEEQLQIKNLYQQGLTSKQLAKQFNCSSTTIMKVVRS